MTDYENMYSDTEGPIVDMEHALLTGTKAPAASAPSPAAAQVSTDPAETPEVEAAAPEPVAVIEEPDEPDEPEEVEVADIEEDVEPEGLSDGASSRFQKLVGRAKAAEEKASKFEELLSQLTAAQRAQLDLQTEAWQFQKGTHDAQAARQLAIQREQQLREAGWDLNRPEHRLLLEERAAREQLEAQIHALSHQSQAAQEQALTAQWENGIDQVLRSKLSEFDVRPTAVAKFQAQAMKIAAASRLTSPVDAVDAVLEPILEYLKPKTGKTKSGPGKGVAAGDQKAFEALSARGKTTSKPAKVAADRSIDEIERETFGIKDGWG